jgi:hypothetical protein
MCNWDLDFLTTLKLKNGADKVLWPKKYSVLQ